MTPPPKYPQYLHTLKIFIFLKKNSEIQNFESQNMTRAYVCMKISEYPPPHPIQVFPLFWFFFYLVESYLLYFYNFLVYR